LFPFLHAESLVEPATGLIYLTFKNCVKFTQLISRIVPEIGAELEINLKIEAEVHKLILQGLHLSEWVSYTFSQAADGAIQVTKCGQNSAQ